MTRRPSWSSIGRELVSDRTALACFVAYLAVAYPLILFHFGKDEWFVHDDWNLISDSTVNLFTAVEQHWSTLPILVYRACFRVFGANYLPFLALVSGLHLGIVCLLRVVMRRAGVSGWMSTIVAAQLVLFGAGHMAILFAIEITQNLSLVLGLSQLILADHDGKLDRRDGYGLAAGALGLTSSGLSPLLVICVGLATLFRRGPRAALFHTVPLAAIYLTWFAIVRPTSFGVPDAYSLPFSMKTEILFTLVGIVGSAHALGHFKALAVALVAIAIGGCVLRLSSGARVEPRSRMAAPLALLAGAPLYFAIIGMQRSRMGIGYALFSHHLYTAVAFSLPSLACGAEAIARRWRRSLPFLAGLLVLPIPFNWGHALWVDRSSAFNRVEFTQENKRLLLTIAHSPYPAQALHLDRSKPAGNPIYTGNISLGWLLDQAKAGRIPKLDPRDQGVEDHVELLYAFTDFGVPPAGARCSEHEGPLELRPQPGDEILTGGPVLVYNLRHELSQDAMLPLVNVYYPAQGHHVRVELPHLHIVLEPVSGTSFPLCTAPR